MLTEYTTKDLLWDGPNIPCLHLCKGDTVSEVIYKIADKVCCIKDDLDIETLSYQCILDKSRLHGEVDLFLLFAVLLKNDCDLYDLIEKKIDESDTTELLVDNLDLKCFLQSYLDAKCTIVRFYNNEFAVIDPNDITTVFQKAEIKKEGIYYVSDIDQSVWIYNGNLQNYVKTDDDLNTLCICDIRDLDLDLKLSLKVIITNLCQTKSTGVIKACDSLYKTITFDTIDPNTAPTVFTGSGILPGDPIIENQNFYYISTVSHNIWRWVDDLNAYLPSLLSSANISLGSLSACLLNSEIALQNWVDLYNVYQEPIIDSCLSSTLSLSSHVIQVSDANVCALQSMVGTKTDLNKVIGNYCEGVCYFGGTVNGQMYFDSIDCMTPNVNTYYISTVDYKVYKWNGAMYVEYVYVLPTVEIKQWDDICNLLDKIKNIEQTCCTPSCDNTTIGFSTVYNVQDNIFILTFDKASGTNIPDDFVDCGSVLTATDWKGNKVHLEIEITQDAEIELDMSTLDISKNVNVNIKSCLSNSVLTCKNCVSGLLPPINLCQTCKICVASGEENDTDFVEITYVVASQPDNLINIKLKPGQCLTFSLPEDTPAIKFIRYSSGNVVLENSADSPCENLVFPAPVADTCWFFEIPMPQTHYIVLDGTTGVPLSNVGNLIFALSPTYDLADAFESYKDYLNQTTINDYTVNLPSLADNTIYSVFPNLPSGLPSNVIEKTLCSGVNIITIDDYPGIPGIGIVPIALGVISPQQELTSTQEIQGGSFGFILKVAGQPTGINGIQQPEISIKNHLNSTISYIKGILLEDDCQCP